MNSESSTSTATDARIATIAKKLQSVAARTRRGAILTALLGVILMAAAAAYFTYGYQTLASVMEPATLVSLAETFIEDQIPETRKLVAAEVTRSSPVWAASLSKQAQTQLPVVRGRLEEYVLKQVDEVVDSTAQLTEQHFREFLKENRGTLERGFKDLSTSPQLADESLANLEQAIERHLQIDMKEGAESLFLTVDLMQQKLARLKVGQTLTPEESLERHIVMLVRRLQSENIQP